jgi:4-diphosphocytidyl-2-C-methyl-D-erythritol kinase
MVNADAELGLNTDEMTKILAEIGSDTAFFLHLPAAIGTGRGEILKPVAVPKLYLILINPKIFISTKKIFGNERLKLTTPSDIPSIKDSFRFEDITDRMTNDLQPAAEWLHPVIAELCHALKLSGAAKAMMTGSGSTVFGIFGDEGARDKAFEQLNFPEYLVYRAEGLI